MKEASNQTITCFFVRTESSFFGQMGPCIYMFETALSSATVKQIYELGPNYAGAFLPEQHSSSSPSSLSPLSVSTVLDGSLAKYLWLHYSCKVGWLVVLFFWLMHFPFSGLRSSYLPQSRQ